MYNDTNRTDDPTEIYMDLWSPSCIKACKELKPDLIVYDFFSRAGNLAADEMGIPSVNFFIGPLIIFKEFCLYDTPDFKNARTCCGCICVKKPRDRGCIKILMDASPYADYYKRHN